MVPLDTTTPDIIVQRRTEIMDVVTPRLCESPRREFYLSKEGQSVVERSTEF